MPIISKAIILLIIFLSSHLHAKENDVYYCTTENVVQTNNEGTETFKDFKFTFKRYSNYINIKADTWWDETIYQIISSDTKDEVFTLKDEDDYLYYFNGHLMYSAQVYSSEKKAENFIFSIFANCEIF